jgi:hypothetical protein
MSTLDQAIRQMIAEEVAAAERRIRESLHAAADRDLSFVEACEYLNMSEYTLRHLCRSKRIPFRTHGAENSKRPIYLFSSNSLDQWKREQEAANYQVK